MLADISADNLPAEIIPEYTTLEYIVSPLQTVDPSVFLLVIDTCIAGDIDTHLCFVLFKVHRGKMQS